MTGEQLFNKLGWKRKGTDPLNYEGFNDGKITESQKNMRGEK